MFTKVLGLLLIFLGCFCCVYGATVAHLPNLCIQSVHTNCGNLSSTVVCYGTLKFHNWCDFMDAACNGTLPANITTPHQPVDPECIIIVTTGPLPTAVQHTYPTTTKRPISTFEARFYSAAIHSIDDLLISANKSGATIDEQKKIFSTQDHVHKHYVRSPNCWAHSLDLTAISPWNSQGHTRRAGVLISPRHAIWARHYSMKVNTTLRFISNNNDVIDRKITKTRAVPTEGEAYLHGHDIVVGELDHDVPPEITYVKVMPRNLTTIRTYNPTIPVFDTDFEEKALVADLYYESGNMVSLRTPSHNSLRYPFFEPKITGDSGNPVFLVIDRELILLFVFTYGGSGSGTSVTYQYDNINHILQQWGSSYQLTEVDLTKFLDSGNNVPNIIG